MTLVPVQSTSPAVTRETIFSEPTHRRPSLNVRTNGTIARDILSFAR